MNLVTIKVKHAFLRASLIVLLTVGLNVFAAADERRLGADRGILVVVGSPYIELSVQPGRGYAKLHAVEKNERIRIHKSRTDWYKVEAPGGKTGWVHRRELHTIYDTEGFLLDFSAPSWSEAQSPWQIGLLAGDFEGAIAYTIITGYRFTPNISAEIKYTQAFGDFSNAKLGSLMLVHQPFPQWRVSPFFTLGAGMLKSYPDVVLVDPADQEDSALSVGGGLMVYLSHKVIARIEYNHHTLLTTRDNNDEVEEWKAGFSVLF